MAASNIADAYVQISAKFDKASVDKAFDQIVAGANSAGEGVQGAMVEASRQSNDAVERSLGKAAAMWDDIIAGADSSGEGIQRAFTEAGTQSDEALNRSLGKAAAMWDEIMAAADHTGEGVQNSFVEAGRQSGEALDKVGTADVWGNVETGAERAGETIQQSFVEAGRQSDEALNKIGGPEEFAAVRNEAERTGEGIEGSFREAARQSNEHLSTIASVGGGMLRTIGTLAATVGFGFFLKDATAQAIDANSVLAQTNQLLIATGDASGFTSAQLQDMAGNLSLKIGVDDDDILSASNVLLTFKSVTGDTFGTAMSLAADMTAVFGGDLNGAVTQLGKALQDPVKGISALSRVGVSFTQEQKDQIKAMVDAGDVAGAQGVILHELQGEVGGAAEATATGTQKMAVAWGNLKEALGGGIADALSTLAPSVVSLVDSLQPLLGNLGSSLGGLLTPLLAAFGPALASAMGIISNVMANFGTILGTLAPLVAPLVTLFGVFATNIAGGLVAAFKALAPSIQQVADFLGPLTGILAGTFGAALNALMPMMTAVGQVFSGVLAEILPIITKMFQDLSPQIVAISTIFGGALATSLPQIALVFGQLVKTIAPLIPMLVAGLLPTLRALTPVLPVLIDFLIAWKFAQIGVNLAMDANPVLLVTVAIVALIGGVKAAYDHFQSFHDAVQNAWLMMQTAWDFITSFFVIMWHDLDSAIHTVIDTFANLPAAMGAALTAVGDFVTGLPAMILAMVTTAISLFVELHVRAVEAALGLVIDATELFLSLPGRAASALGGLAGAVLGKVAEMATEALGALGGFVGNMLGGLGNFVSGIPGALGGFASSIVGAVTSGGASAVTAVGTFVTNMLGKLGDFVTGIPGAIAGAGSALVSGLHSALKNAWNTVVDHLPSFHAGLGPLPDVNLSMDFLRLQTGGIIDAPTLALLGERNRREVAIPVTNPGRAMSLMQQSGLGAMWDQRGGGGGGPLVSFPNAVIAGATDAELVGQKVNVALAIRGMS